ncbi:hypothetical protein HMPREF0880_03973 [Yokenella regensburgei ATCC 43003]|nr:hypothetical protein HMPREF0880_03973 [Yokenella regensburgei ATCC 43003]
MLEVFTAKMKIIMIDNVLKMILACNTARVSHTSGTSVAT